MATATRGRITELLAATREGETDALDELYRIVHDDLRKVAARQMGRLPLKEVLQPTALVHEAYLRLIGRADLQPVDSRQFFGMLSMAMRDIMCEEARRQGSLKRGGGWRRVGLDETSASSADNTVDVLALHRALENLKQIDPEGEEIVRLRFFGGLTLQQVALVMDLSVSTAQRSWNYAKAWLHTQLTEN